MMKAVRLFLKGFRTIGAVLAFLITGLLGAVGTLDLTPVVALFVKDPARLGAAMVMVAALFGWLRWLTTSPLFTPHPVKTDVVDEAPVGDRPRALDTGV